MFIVTLVFESFTKGILTKYNKNSNVLFMITLQSGYLFIQGPYPRSPYPRLDCGFRYSRLVMNSNNLYRLNKPIDPGGWSCKL